MMSDKENSTLEMETKKNFDTILKAILEMRQDFGQRFDGLDKRIDKFEAEQAEMKEFMTVQFEAIRQGLVKNYNEFNRMNHELPRIVQQFSARKHWSAN